MDMIGFTYNYTWLHIHRSFLPFVLGSISEPDTYWSEPIISLGPGHQMRLSLSTNTRAIRTIHDPVCRFLPPRYTCSAQLSESALSAASCYPLDSMSPRQFRQKLHEQVTSMQSPQWNGSFWQERKILPFPMKHQRLILLFTVSLYILPDPEKKET